MDSSPLSNPLPYEPLPIRKLLEALLGPEGRRRLALREKTNQELFNLYNDDLVLRLHNAKNLRDTCTLLGHFVKFLGEYPPSPELAKSFLARYAGYNAHTLYRYTQMIAAFMKWYGEPLNDLHIKVPKSLPEYTEDADIEKLMAAIANKKSHTGVIKRDKLLVELALTTGMRRSELANLKPEDIHENALIVRQGKGKKDRMIPLTQDVAKRLHVFIKEVKPGQSVFRLGAPWISMKIKQFARKAGLPQMHAHALRHKFATDLLESGADIRVVQALLGHQNLNTTEVYLSLTDRRLYEAIEKKEKYKNTGLTPNKFQSGTSTIQDQAPTTVKPNGYHPSAVKLQKTDIAAYNGQAPHFETSHKQQMRESAKALLNQISFPFIGERIIDKPTAQTESPKIQVKREWLTGDAILEGLRSHLQTGGYLKVIEDLDEFDREDAANLVSCYRFIDLVKNEIEKKFQVSLPVSDDENVGFTISFVQTVCADAVERIRGSNHYKYFPYRYDGLNLLFGAYVIYAGGRGQNLKPYEAIHREMREKCSRWEQPEVISKQIDRISEIILVLKRQLETFALLEHIPGKCHLCHMPLDT